MAEQTSTEGATEQIVGAADSLARMSKAGRSDFASLRPALSAEDESLLSLLDADAHTVRRHPSRLKAISTSPCPAIAD